MAPAPVSSTNAGPVLPAGQHVEVRCRYDGRWVDGFDVAEPVADGYRVRRSLDGRVLPSDFSRDDVRAASPL
ncbi:MAG: hypothetical protein JWM05_2438 [Acidimicrobiales bacterium]|jgi:hypothetical protein|nr:hypothetical protein [Acidimicrobiales bacterium]